MRIQHLPTRSFISLVDGIIDRPQVPWANMMGPPIFKFWNLSLLGLMAKIKCSICSYQFNIWYAGHSPAQILIWFLSLGLGSEVYLTLTTGCLGIALQPSAAHYSIKKFGHIGLPVILTCYVIWSYDAIGLQALLLGPTLVCHVLFSTMLHHNIEENINECVPSIFMWGWRSP